MRFETQCLLFYADKCLVMIYAPKSCPLPLLGLPPYKTDEEFMKFVTCHSDLGVCIDRSLKFHEHIRRNVAVVENFTTNLVSCTVCRDPTSSLIFTLPMSGLSLSMHPRSGILGISLIADYLNVFSADGLAPSKVLKICSIMRDCEDLIYFLSVVTFCDLT